MNLNLNQTLSWTCATSGASPDSAAEVAMLHELQGNILKGHGRDFTANLFLSFDRKSAAEARSFVAGVGEVVTSALDQLTKAQVYKATGVDAGSFVAFFLTAKGYDALGKLEAMPGDEAFVAGMKTRKLDDPAVGDWESHFAEEVHGLILVAADSDPERNKLRARFEQRIVQSKGAVRLLGVEMGNAIRNADKNGIEHFGYVDGRSQPLALKEDVDNEKKIGGIDQWNPSIPLSQVLVKCPGGRLEVSHGSYFVFRKLEQNVKGFKQREDALADALGGIGERAGASVVGRFENGTPVVSSAIEVKPIPPGPAGVPNNFNYAGPDSEFKCPFAGHIRKTNPRTDTPDSKTHLMARRGIPYGQRSDGPNDDQIDNKPTGGVGLLFMAYQSNLVDQFEFTQRIWANSVDFRRPNTGIDPIIGQPAGGAGQRFPDVYGKSLGSAFDFSGFVKMRGGEYFFAPSLSFLKSIDH